MAYPLLMYVGLWEWEWEVLCVTMLCYVFLRNFPFPFVGEVRLNRINEIKGACDTFFPDNRQGGP